MKYLCLTIALLISAHVVQAQSYINIVLLHQLVENNKSEYERQVDGKKNQMIVDASEMINKGLLGEVKDKYRVIQERFSKMSIVFDAVGVAKTANPILKSIIDNQQQIIYYCQVDPSFAPFALETEILFVDRSKSLISFLVGVCASIGDINQMKVSERRILFKHIIDELREINQISMGAARSLQSNILNNIGIDPFEGYVNDDLKIVEEILANVKFLK